MKKLIAVITIATLIISCKKSGSDGGSTTLKITSFSPSSARYNDELTINGTNFTSSGNTVTINGVAATIKTQTATKITVSVPEHVGSGEIKVMNTNGTTIASTGFTYTPNVFICGTDNSKAVVWKNNTATYLTDGSYLTTAGALFVKGNDVYVGGSELNSSFVPVAKYWKNGTPVALTNGNYSAYVTGIVINNGDVFVSGYEKNAGGKAVAKYWKNGTEVVLTDGTKNAYAYGIVIVNNDVHVCGSEEKNSKTVAKHWKNGVGVELSDPAYYGSANSIIENNGDIYITGYDNDQASYWKNDVKTLLDPTSYGAAGISFDGSDMYINGNEVKSGIEVVKYWKNGVAVALSDGTKRTFTKDIKAYENKVYVTGTEFTGGTVGKTAKYWVNGGANTLAQGDNTGASAIVIQ